LSGVRVGKDGTSIRGLSQTYVVRLARSPYKNSGGKTPVNSLLFIETCQSLTKSDHWPPTGATPLVRPTPGIISSARGIVPLRRLSLFPFQENEENHQPTNIDVLFATHTHLDICSRTNISASILDIRKTSDGMLPDR
jgi:hypothetical protein